MNKRYAIIDAAGIVLATGIADELPDNAVELSAGVVLDRIVGGTYKDDQFTPLTDLQWAQRAANKDISDFAEQARAALTRGASSLQIASWASKEARAQRLTAGTASDVDKAILIAEVDKRGRNEPISALAEKQVQKANKLMGAVGVIDGMINKATDKVSKVDSVEALEKLLLSLKTQAQAELNQLLSA